MNSWIWIHPTIGGSLLVNLTNVVYLLGNTDGTTTIALSNGREIIAKESIDFLIELMSGKVNF